MIDNELAKYCFYVHSFVSSIPFSTKYEITQCASSKKEYTHTFCREYELDLTEMKTAQDVENKYLEFLRDSWKCMDAYVKGHEEITKAVILMMPQCHTVFLGKAYFRMVVAFEIEQENKI